MTKTYTGHMGIDQFGETYHSLGRFPRKALLERLDATHADKMYVDSSRVGGRTSHTGWIIRGHWINVYRVLSLHEGG